MLLCVFSRAVSNCEIFMSYDLFGAELNLLAPLSCNVGLGPEDKRIRACTPSHSWLGLDTCLISARLFGVPPATSFFPPSRCKRREEVGADEHMTEGMWMDGVKAWKAAYHWHLPLLLMCRRRKEMQPGFEYNCLFWHISFTFVLESSTFDYTIVIGQWKWKQALHVLSELLSSLTVTIGRAFCILSITWFMGQWQ